MLVPSSLVVREEPTTRSQHSRRLASSCPTLLPNSVKRCWLPWNNTTRRSKEEKKVRDEEERRNPLSVCFFPEPQWIIPSPHVGLNITSRHNAGNLRKKQAIPYWISSVVTRMQEVAGQFLFLHVLHLLLTTPSSIAQSAERVAVNHKVADWKN